MKNEPFIIERVLNAPIAKVWKAISDRDAMRQWYFDLEKFIPEPGFEFRFFGGEEGGRKYLHICRITEVVNEKKLAYSWRYEGYEGNSLVCFELTEEGDKTKLKLTHSGLETFPLSNPDFAKADFVEGWTMLIGTLLPAFIEK